MANHCEVVIQKDIWTATCWIPEILVAQARGKKLKIRASTGWSEGWEIKTVNRKIATEYVDQHPEQFKRYQEVHIEE